MCLLKKDFSFHRSACLVQTKYFSLQEQITSVQEKGNEYRIMSITNLSRSGTQTKTFRELLCSPSLVDGLQQESVPFAAVNIFLSITTFLGNSLILFALHKESSLHPPSKLLYRCLSTTDLLVGLVDQPLHVICWMSVVLTEAWSLCHYAGEAAYITGVALCGVSLLTMTAISVDRLLALLLGLRYKDIVTLKRIYIIVATVWVLCFVGSLSTILYQRITSFYGAGWTLIPLSLLFHSPRTQRFFALSDIFRHKYKIIFNNSRANQMHRTWRDTERQCTVHCGYSQHQSLLYTILYGGNCSLLQYNIFITLSHYKGNGNYPCLL